MSWGERSCTTRKCKGATYESCNVDCPCYEWDGKTNPDSQVGAFKLEDLLETETKGRKDANTNQ